MIHVAQVAVGVAQAHQRLGYLSVLQAELPLLDAQRSFEEVALQADVAQATVDVALKASLKIYTHIYADIQYY